MALKRLTRKEKERKNKIAEYPSTSEQYLTKNQIREVASLRKTQKKEALQLRGNGLKKLEESKEISINDYMWDDGTDFTQKKQGKSQPIQTIFIKKLLKENTLDSNSDLTLDEFFDSLFQLPLDSAADFLSIEDLEKIKAIRKNKSFTQKVQFRKKE